VNFSVEAQDDVKESSIHYLPAVKTWLSWHASNVCVHSNELSSLFRLLALKYLN